MIQKQYILLFSLLVITTSLILCLAGVHGYEAAAADSALQAGGSTSNTTNKCSVDQNFNLQDGDALFPIECQVGPQFNQFRFNYSITGTGASAYLLTEPQFYTYLEKAKQDPSYVPQTYETDYYLRIYIWNIGYSTGGKWVSMTRNDFGIVRLLVKQNPDFSQDVSSIYVNMNIIPQLDNTERNVIVGTSVTGVIGLVCICLGCVVYVFIVRRRKTSYQSII